MSEQIAATVPSGRVGVLATKLACLSLDAEWATALDRITPLMQAAETGSLNNVTEKQLGGLQELAYEVVGAASCMPDGMSDEDRAWVAKRLSVVAPLIQVHALLVLAERTDDATGQELRNRVVEKYLRPLYSELDGDRPNIARRVAETSEVAAAARNGDAIADEASALAESWMSRDRIATVASIQSRGLQGGQRDVRREDSESTLDGLLDELNALIGLGEVKREVATITNLLRVQTLRAEAGLSLDSPISA